MRTIHIMRALKADNPIFFDKGNDRFFGVQSRDVKQLKDGRIFMIEHHVEPRFNVDRRVLFRVTIDDETDKFVINRLKEFSTSIGVLEYLQSIERASNDEAF